MEEEVKTCARMKLSLIWFTLVIQLTFSVAMNAATFYEIWRNTEPELSTANRIESWYANDSSETIEYTDPNTESNQIYYYWVRSFNGTYIEDYQSNGQNTFYLRLWYATETKAAPIEPGSYGWPYRVTLEMTLCDGSGGDYFVELYTNVWESDHPLGELSKDIHIKNWNENLWSQQECYARYYPDAITYDPLPIDLYSTELNGWDDWDGDAEVFGECRVVWGRPDYTEQTATEVIKVNFITLSPAPVVTVTKETQGIQLAWPGTPNQTTEFSTMVRTPKRIYVNGWQNSGSHDGTDWDNAFQHLQDALNEASSGDEIWVTRYGPGGTDGVYLPDVDKNTPSTSDRSASFIIPSGVSIYGGFIGNETSLEERDWKYNQTILSGDIGDYDSLNDNSYHVVTFMDCDENTIIDGFAIERGYTSLPYLFEPDDRGTGIFVANSNPIIKNCEVCNNTATMGAGIYCLESSPAIISCLVYNNLTIGFGGSGIYNEFSETAIINSHIFLNNALEDIINLVGGDGAAIYNENSSVSIVNSLFIYNTAQKNAGGVYNWDCMPELINCTFYGNKADGDGGAIYSSDYFGYEAVATIKNSIFWANPDSNADPITGAIDGTSQIAGSLPVIYNSCIQDVDSEDSNIPFSGTLNNNIDDNPDFAVIPNPGPDGNWDGIDDDLGDLKLQNDSPCIEAGNNIFLPVDLFDLDDDSKIDELIPVDAANHNRFVDRDRDLFSMVDMGAYERGICPENPDFDNSQRVDYIDFSYLSDKWTHNDCDCYASCCDNTDLNSDGKIDIEDLYILCQFWLSKPEVAENPNIYHWSVNGHYYELVEISLSWADAEKAAKSKIYNGMQGHLVTITEEPENVMICDHVLANSIVWIGGYQSDTESEQENEYHLNWHWVTGQEWGYTNWRTHTAQEPNDANDGPDGIKEDFLELRIAGDGAEFNRGEWNDMTGSELRHYIIEYE